jgi:hypothetical protein
VLPQQRLVQDQAGSNNWTPSGSPGFSVTAGAGNDSLVDTPTQYGTDTGAGGEVRGNYCTLNAVDKDPITTLSNGNLDMVASVANWADARGTMAMTTGKWYFEVRRTGTQNIMAGVASSVATGTNSDPTHLYQSPTGYFYYSTGEKYNNNAVSAYGAAIAQNDYIGVAFDADARTLVFYKNGVSQGTAYTVTSGFTYLPAVIVFSTTGSIEANFGQRPFAHTAPSGFKALVTTNLPEPTVVQGDDYFNTVLYTGNTPSTNAITGVGFAPDWVWVKSRTVAEPSNLVDRVRGDNLRLKSSTTDAESAATFALNSDGFTVGANSESNTGSMVAWNWKADGAGVSNQRRRVRFPARSQSANTIAGISIVTYTGSGANATVGHGLGVQPFMVIVKNRDNGAAGWYVEHIKLTGFGTYTIFLNQTSAESANSAHWNDTAPTSSVFSVGTSGGTNESGSSHVAYCFAEVEGFSKFGSYTGNASADGPFVYTGFRPAFVMVKSSSSAVGNWLMQNNKTLGYNPSNSELYANLTNAETTADRADLLSNGFKPRVNSAENNSSGVTYIYMAFAESPFKNSLAR